MQTIELNKKVTSIEVQDDRIIINLEQEYIPKDGEYFYVKSKTGNEFIAIKSGNSRITTRYCSYKNKEYLFLDDDFICENSDIEEILPATAEEKELLDKALEARGKRWNPETKQIEKLPKIGDFCIFWGRYKRYAVCAVLKDMLEDSAFPYVTSIGQYSNCVMFQSAEHFKEFIKE